MNEVVSYISISWIKTPRRLYGNVDGIVDRLALEGLYTLLLWLIVVFVANPNSTANSCLMTVKTAHVNCAY